MDGLKTDWKNDHSSLQVITNPALPDSLSQVREIVRVWTDPDHRRQGYATDLVRQVCEESDIEGVVLLLQPREFGKSNGHKDLQGFYKKFGFVKIQDNPVLMARQPRFTPQRKPMVDALERLNG